MPSAVKAGSRYMAAKPRSPSARAASSMWAAYRCTHPSSPRRYEPRYPSGAGIVATWAGCSPLALWVPITSSTSRDQVIFVDHASDVSLSSDAVQVEVDRPG
jgi:hypothetical protein